MCELQNPGLGGHIPCATSTFPNLYPMVLNPCPNSMLQVLGGIGKRGGLQTTPMATERRHRSKLWVRYSPRCIPFPQPLPFSHFSGEEGQAPMLPAAACEYAFMYRNRDELGHRATPWTSVHGVISHRGSRPLPRAPTQVCSHRSHRLRHVSTITITPARLPRSNPSSCSPSHLPP
jgi:hypothetical protein